MKKLLIFVLSVIFIAGFSTISFAQLHAFLYVDSAPNTYGSPNWAPWWIQTKADVVAGTFTNMRTGTFPGTTTMSPYDEIVYSTGDLGKRLHWIYWLPDHTIAQLGSNFQVKWVIDWYGNDWTVNPAGNWILDDPNVGWSTPKSWENYAGGVIGSFGFAWWATDNNALPFSTDSNPYNETNQADIDALASMVLDYQTFAHGYIRYTHESGNVYMADINVTMIPEPGTFLLLGSGMLGLGFVGWYRKRRS